MDRRFLAVLSVSLVFALVVTAVFYQMTSRAGGPSKEGLTDLKDVVIAARPLSVGLTIKAEDLKVVKVPADAFPKGGFSKPEDVLDRPVISNILNEEALIEGRLAQRGSGVGLAPIIPVGMRAVTVRVNDVVGVAGFVLPGMRVDVLITGTPPGTENRVTRTVLQNITVLSAGANIQTDATGKPVNAPNVTLLVTPQQAETLTLAGNEGRIQLVLRNAGDQSIESTSGLSLRALYGPQADVPAVVNSPARVMTAATEQEHRKPQVTVAPVTAALAAPELEQIVTIRGTEKKVEAVMIRRAEATGVAQ